MLLGCIADDFTGAGDLASTLTRAGMATSLFSGIPDAREASKCEAGVIALKTRSVPREEAVTTALSAFEWLHAQDCTQYFFKYCSTFDSTPEGNIGPVAEALASALNADAVIVCPAFPEAGRTLYQGHLFVGDRLLSESGMERHPLNPMTDPDIRRWLSQQTQGSVGSVVHAIVRRGGQAIREAIAGEAARGRRLVVVDAISDVDLLAIGAAAERHVLVTGASGAALGLPENFRRAGRLSGDAPMIPAFTGPGAVLCGSCSAASNRQVTLYARSHPAFAIAPDDLMAGRADAAHLAEGMIERLNEAPIAYSTAEPKRVEAAQRRHGRDAVAAAFEKLFGELARRLVAAGVTRLAVGGGETSGAVVEALGLGRLAIGPEIDPGVPAMAHAQAPRLGLALKSGNFGADDFFEKSMTALAGRPMR